MGDDDASLATLAAAGSAPPTVGQRFAGRYVVERLLGRGAMGSVWGVLDTQLAERVALKVLHTEGRDSQDAIERFRREVRLARRITHPNVARIYDIGEHHNVLYLTMECVAGASLAERLEGGRWPAGRALAVAEQIASGLAAAHAVGIVHRDLKPANVLVEDGGRAVLTDFGIACALSGEIKLTVENAWMGTPAYMSPEQVRGEPVDARSDVYALGTILFEMLTGQLPFTGNGMYAVALARLQGPAPDPGGIVPLEQGVVELVQRCLATHAAERPASAAELLTAIRGLDPGRGQAAPSVAPELAAARGDDATASSTFASLRVGEQGIAVLPFRYRGPESDEYLADALTDELVDLLSSTRGLKVAARGATSRFRDVPDPRRIGEELGVDAIIDGTVQRAGDLVRISARLLATDTGFQTWSERFEGRLDDVFDLQDRMAKRVAESLRLELQQRASLVGECSAEAVELYLRARKHARSQDMGGMGEDGARALLERCLALAPRFKPALALDAIVNERMWFFPIAPRDVDWAERTRLAVARALAEASDLAETHVAAARYAASTQDFAGAARALTRALQIAPTSAGAHEYLGILQCEAGRAHEGIRHVELAAELDPSLTMGLMAAARHYALAGDHARCGEYLQRVDRQLVGIDAGLVTMKARFAMWRADAEAVERCRKGIPRLSQVHGASASFMEGFSALYMDLFLGARDVAELDGFEPPSEGFGPRFRTLIEQLIAEVCAHLGAIDRAMAALSRAADNALVDLDWLERCPLLTPLRSHADYAALHERVRTRAEQIWTLR